MPNVATSMKQMHLNQTASNAIALCRANHPLLHISVFLTLALNYDTVDFPLTSLLNGAKLMIAFYRRKPTLEYERFLCMC